MRLESANFTSRVYRLNNNPFGMHVPTKRPFLGVRGSGSEYSGMRYAKYPNLWIALKDYKLWQQQWDAYSPYLTAHQYISFLISKGYAEDKGYQQKLLNLIA